MRGALPRAQLFDRLDRDREASSISWISAPAGAGKTTLVASYLQHRQLRFLWYRVDPGDQDLASFFHFLGRAVARAAPRHRRPLPKLTPEYAGGATVFARNFFREQRRAAAVLERAGRAEEALELYLTVGDMDAGARLILATAAELATAGRNATLAAAISELPKDIVESNPWLLYWRGVSGAPSSLLGARSDFEAAFALFDARGDVAGVYLGWTAIVQNYFAEYRDYRPARAWTVRNTASSFAGSASSAVWEIRP